MKEKCREVEGRVEKRRVERVHIPRWCMYMCTLSLLYFLRERGLLYNNKNRTGLNTMRMNAVCHAYHDTYNQNK